MEKYFICDSFKITQMRTFIQNTLSRNTSKQTLRVRLIVILRSISSFLLCLKNKKKNLTIKNTINTF